MNTSQDTEAPIAEAPRAKALVVVADDHPLYRAGIVRALDDTGRFVVVGEAGDGQTALELILHERPDLAIVDVRMPRIDGLSLLARVRRERVPVSILMLSAFTDSLLVEFALSHGAVAYVDKATDREELVAIAIAVVGGGHVEVPHGSGSPVLLPIERTILSMLRDGWTLRDLPHLMKADRASVERYARDAATRLGVERPEDAVAAAVAWGLLD